LQCAVIEYARNVCGLKNANSSEFIEGSASVIDLMLEQKKVATKGGTMRLGSYPCILKKGSLANKIYRDQFIVERHRHRYEVNNEFRALLEENGLIFGGVSPDGKLVEMIELPNSVHPFFIGGQFHQSLRVGRQKRIHFSESLSKQV